MKRLFDETRNEIGFRIVTHAFIIHYGDELYKHLKMLEQQGVTTESFFPASYHGVQMPSNLRMLVTNASQELSWKENIRHCPKFQQSISFNKCF